jgi:hypothetical protein
MGFAYDFYLVFGWVQLFSIGIVGQYVGKTYIETKERPRYTVTEILDYETKTN